MLGGLPIIFTIKVKAKDINGAQTEWAYHSLNIPKNKFFNNPILQRILTFFIPFISNA